MLAKKPSAAATEHTPDPRAAGNSLWTRSSPVRALCQHPVYPVWQPMDRRSQERKAFPTAPAAAGSNPDIRASRAAFGPHPSGGRPSRHAEGQGTKLTTSRISAFSLQPFGGLDPTKETGAAMV
jgi:hypothetical protein